MFASRLNYQIKPFVSWHPDPEAKSHDAFSIQWKGYLSYCFPPFALINRVLRKIEAEQVTVMLVFPHWTMQTWYPRLLRLLTARPVLLPWADDLLYLPHRPGERHPLAGRLTLCAALLSGNPLAREAFHTTLPTSLWKPGDQPRRSSTSQPCQDGYISAAEGRYIQFDQL